MKIKSYAEGGFLDDGATVDPMSGNEVPTGSLQEEVRDDIPAQLSEGEFVVPADVVRFIGLDKLMKMRDSAKKGLASMEAEGQIGGSAAPAMPPEMSMQEEPMDIDAMIDGMEDDGMGFAEGGVATYASLMGNEFGSVPTTKNAVYMNAAGNKVFIPIVEGEPAYAPPEGYTLVVDEDDKVEEETPEEELIEAAKPVTNNQDNQDLAQNGGRYEGDVSRSEKIRKDRSTKIESLASANMSSGQMDIMYAALTPQAKSIYDTRFRDKSTRGFLDGFMADGQSPTDLLITAQKTADTQNRMAGTVEPDSGFLPNGKPIDWAKALKYVGAGLVLGPTGMVGSALKFMSDEERATAKSTLTEVGKILGSIGQDSPFKNNTNQPSEIVNDPYTKLNQDYWRSFTGDVASEQRRLEEETGLNAYGHKIYKEPGSRSVWDNIAEVQANQANSEKVRADNAADNAREDRLLSGGDNYNSTKVADAAQAAAQAAVQAAVTEKEDMYSSGGGGTSSPVANGPPGRNYKDDSGTSSPVANGPPGRNYKDDSEDDSEDGFMNRGGLASKKKPAVMKMRKDPTAGIAAKKKSKKKAQAKKGALAAKRT